MSSGWNPSIQSMVSGSFVRSECARACNNGVGVTKRTPPSAKSTALTMLLLNCSRASPRCASPSIRSGAEAAARIKRLAAPITRLKIALQHVPQFGIHAGSYEQQTGDQVRISPAPAVEDDLCHNSHLLRHQKPL